MIHTNFESCMIIPKLGGVVLRSWNRWVGACVHACVGGDRLTYGYIPDRRHCLCMPTAQSHDAPRDTRPDPTQPVQVKQWLPLLSPIDRVGCIVFAGEATLIDDDAPITFLATESNKKEARANTLHHGCNAV